jgi:signal transduction histidine kinase
VNLRLHLVEGSLPVQADPDQIKQVLLNLLQNALESIEGRGEIAVKSRVDSGTVEIIIQDSGPGIPEDLRDRIFEPFFTTKSQGTGLGLAITRNIVQDHGGSIRFECPPRHGTAFIIELPLDAAAAPSA